MLTAISGGRKVVNYGFIHAAHNQDKRRRQRMTLTVHGNMHGFRGVEWCERKTAFRARICPPEKPRGIWLGTFPTAVGAAIEYDRAARKFYGEDAALNFPNAGEKQAVRSISASEGHCIAGHNLSTYGRRSGGRNVVQCKLCNKEAVKRYRKKKEII